MRPRKPKPPMDEPALYDYAIGALGRRMRSVAELKRLLRQKAGIQPNSDQMVENIIQRLKEQRYLNDTAYATAYSTYRKENEKFGRQRVITDLKTKGVHADVIEKAIDSAYDGVNEEQLAREYLRRKRMAEPTDQKQAARVFRALVRAGFRSRTIITILKKWNVDDDLLTAMEGEGANASEADEQ